MKILITGNEGFIGKYLENAYLSSRENVFGWSRDGIKQKDKCILNLNLMKYEEVCEAISLIKPDIIVHCAGNANVNLSFEKPFMDLQSNYITTHNLLFAMKDNCMKNCRFILLSSAAVYGNPNSLPISEMDAVNPLSPYALHKLSAEEICKYMSKNYGFDIKILRIFSAYGPRLKKQIFWDMYQKVLLTGELELWGSGYESRDYIYINDLIQAIELIASKAPSGELIYNIANGKEVSIREVAECFARCMKIPNNNIKFKGVRREGDPINWKANIDKLLSLGYERQISFEAGVKNYIKWLENES